MAKKKKKSDLDTKIEATYYQYFNCVQVNIMSIPSIWNDIKAVLALPTEQQDAEMKKLVEKWRN